MSAHIIKAHKIAKGIAELFTAMDKGFARVESDLVLLKRFRQICFEANIKLEDSIPKLSLLIIQQTKYQLEGDTNRTAETQQEAFDHLIVVRQIIADNILMISDFIEEFNDLWERSFSLSALIKFRLLLEEEFLLLEDELKMLEMAYILDHRKKALNLRKSVFYEIPTAGSVHDNNSEK